MRQKTFRRHGLRAGIVSVVLFCSLCVGLIPAGCGCPAIGCQDTLVVILEGSPPQAYTIEVSVPDGQTHGMQCGINHPPATFFAEVTAIWLNNCGGVELRNFAPGEVTITLLRNNDRISQTFQPSYETLSPGGSGCVECRRGKISLTIPPADTSPEATLFAQASEASRAASRSFVGTPTPTVTR
jgi:hypothetical protein